MSNVIAYYKHLHSIPEPGFQEYKTAAFVEETLAKAGYKITKGISGSTGLIAEYDSGNPGPVLCIRADMDCLTHIIDGQKEFRHTCGHDAHTAMLIAAAEESMTKNMVHKGKVKFLFQPAEELGLGALKILESDILSDVEIMLGMHIRPIEECAEGGVIEAMLYSATRIIKVRISGCQSHGARPHLGINAIDAGCAAIASVNAIHVNPRVPHSIKCTRFISDSGVMNSVPGWAEIVFDMRAQDNETMDALYEKAKKAIKCSVEANGAHVENMEECFYSPAATGLDDGIKAMLHEVAAEVVGDDNVHPPFTTSGGEDFFHYLLKYPHIKGGFVGLGVGAEPGMHHPDMHFDVKYLENGVLIHQKAIERILG